jgi:hypothetical protein
MAVFSLPYANSTENWQMDVDDQLLVANLQGSTGPASLLLFNPTLPTLGVAQWSDGVGLQITSVQQQSLPTAPAWGGASPWPMDPSAQPRTLGLANGTDVLVFVGDESLVVCEWVGGFQALAQSQGSITGLGEVPAWTCAPTDQYFAVSDPTGASQLFLVLGQANAGIVMNWALVGLTGVGLLVQAQGSQSLPGWGPALVAAGPALGYAPFENSGTSPLGDIYTAISNAADPTSQGDLRSLYGNTNTAFTVATWFAWLAANPSPPAGSGYAQADWSAVQSTLLAETQALTVIYSLYANLQALAADLLNQQNMDLAQAIILSNPSSAGNPQVGFWLLQALDAILWGAAALCGETPLLAMGLSAIASLLSAAMGPHTETGPTLIEYTQIQEQIDEAYAALLTTNGMGESELVADGLKCAIIRWMATGTWAWPSTRSIDLAAATQYANRIAFYQSLLPAIYTVFTWQSDSDGPPTYVQKPPAYDYWGQETGGEYTYTMYALAGWWDVDSAGWPSQDLITDLFSTCGVQPQDFWLRQGPWSAMPTHTLG